MHAQDINNNKNDRGRIIEELTRVCTELGLSYEYTEKDFSIKLPVAEPLPLATERGHKPTRRIDPNDFGFLRPDPNGVIEGVDMPDELPPTTTPLDEGKPPKGDDEK